MCMNQCAAVCKVHAYQLVWKPELAALVCCVSFQDLFDILAS